MKYLKNTISEVGLLVWYIERSLKRKFLSIIFCGGEVDNSMQEILGYNIKRGGLGIPDPRISVGKIHRTLEEI